MTPDFTSCDWGTTNLRVRIVRDDAVVKETRSGQVARLKAASKRASPAPAMSPKSCKVACRSIL